MEFLWNFIVNNERTTVLAVVVGIAINVILAGCAFEPAYEKLAAGYKPVLLGQFRIEAPPDQGVEIRSVTLRIDSPRSLPEFSYLELECENCVRR